MVKLRRNNTTTTKRTSRGRVSVTVQAQRWPVSEVRSH